MFDHRPRRRALASMSDNPDAVTRHIIGTEYRRAFAREAGDERVRTTAIHRIAARPTASSQDPASNFIVIDFWMHQWSHFLLRSTEICDVMNASEPWSIYRWTPKTVGDIQTILTGASDDHWPTVSRRLFTSGRDHIGNWQYAQWNEESEDWFNALSLAAYTLALIKAQATADNRRFEFEGAGGIRPVLSAMADAKVDNDGANLRVIALTYLKSGVEGDPILANPQIGASTQV